MNDKLAKSSRSKQITPWDQKKAHTEIVELFLGGRGDELGLPKTGKALVPGCGTVSSGTVFHSITRIIQLGSSEWIRGLIQAVEGSAVGFNISNGNKLTQRRVMMCRFWRRGV
jgi:hypothetical protein